MDLSKLMDVKPYSCFDTSMGRLCLFDYSVKDVEMHRELLGGNIEACSSGDYVRALIKFVCFPESELREGRYKPKSPILTDEDVRRLSDDDLDIIAVEIIKNYRYLCEENVSIVQRAVDGQDVTHSELGDIKYPKKPGESNVDYLYRVSVLYEKEQAEKIRMRMDETFGMPKTLRLVDEQVKEMTRFKKAFEPLNVMNQMFASVTAHPDIAKPFVDTPKILPADIVQKDLLSSVFLNNNPARSTYERLVKYIKDFEQGLDDEHEIGVRLVSFGQAVTFHVNNISYWGPDIITFSGISEDGQRLQLIQNISQLSFLLTGVKKLEDKPKRMGFRLDDGECGREIDE